MGFASETNSNPEMDNESILEFELNEATSETDLTSDDDIYEYDLSLPGNKIPKCQVVKVWEVSYHSWLVRNFQNLFSVLL